jgi:very-short-patch-repair endonuclease
VADLFRGTSDSPWATAEIESVEEATRAVDLARELNDTLWPALMEAVRSVAIEIGPAAIVSITDAGNVLLLLGNVDRLLEAYAGGLFDDEVEAHAEALGPARRRLTRVWARVTNPRYGRALRWVRSLRRHGPASTAGLLEDARRAVDLRARWRELRLDGRPRTCPSEAALASAHERAATPLSRLAKVLCRADVPTLPLADVQSLLDRLVTDAHTAVRVARWRQLEKALLELAGPTFVRELRTMDVDPARWPEVFRYAWQRSCLEAIHVEHPAFATFDGRTHHQFVEEFRGLDKARIELAVHRVRARHAERVVDMCNRFRDQESLVRQEAAKKRRHLPVRELVARAPDVLTALFPCWLASPLSVSQLLPARHLFDVVLFDEASQVLPEDAVPALYRAVQAVVAGDRRQLPPTTFFAALDEGGESEDEAVSGFESILDNLSTFLAPEWHLDWHYRSRDEALIAFSNHHIYRNRLVTFPGPGREPAIGHELVHHAGADGEEESAGPEVRRVVELVSEHAEQRPGESLGVIAMGITHAVRIEAAVDRLRQERPELAEFFDEEKPERFFVKNLERVQGDERDAIVLSVGYGKDRAGRLPYRFGPLLQEGGERRLNVAITRARRRMTVVSSFSHLDMDPGRSTKEGVRLLRGFLEFAASGGRNLGRDDATGEPLNLFEQQVATALEARGISLVPQYGVSRFRLDLAAQHPRKPGRLVLAIECDGATYHSAPTARDRDRLRQQHLEALGWRFHRIWSTDWFLNPEQETVRALQAYEDAVAFADRVDGGGPVAPEPPGPVIPTPMTEAPRTLGFRPAVVPGLAIDDYLDRDLVSLALWLLQRHTLATDSELLPLMMNELGFQRRGAKIVERLEAAIRAARRLATSQK